MAKITSRFPRSLKRLKCKTPINYQCGGKCQPVKNNCKKNPEGMAKNGLEWLKFIEDRKARVAKVNAKRGDRRQYAVDDLGNVSRGAIGRDADPGKRVYKGVGTAISPSKERVRSKAKISSFDDFRDKFRSAYFELRKKNIVRIVRKKEILDFLSKKYSIPELTLNHYFDVMSTKEVSISNDNGQELLHLFTKKGDVDNYYDESKHRVKNYKQFKDGFWEMYAKPGARLGGREPNIDRLLASVSIRYHIPIERAKEYLARLEKEGKIYIYTDAQGKKQFNVSENYADKVAEAKTNQQVKSKKKADSPIANPAPKPPTKTASQSTADTAIAPLEELAKLRVDDNLESLFIDADRLGNKYQTPEEIRAQWKAESAVTQEIADLIDKIPDDDDPTPTPTPVKPVAKVTTPPRKGSAYSGISDPLKKRITGPPPKKDGVGESPAKEKGDEYDFDALGNAHRHFITNTRNVGQSYKEGFESFMAELESKLKESTPQERQGEIPDILDASKQRYFRLMNSIKSTAEGAYSVMMAGGSKFNGKQAARRGNAYDKSISNFVTGLRSIESDALKKTGAQDAIDAKESAKIIKKQQSEKEAKQILKEVQAKFKKTPIINDPNYKNPKRITKAEWAKIPSDYKGVMINPETGVRYRAHMTQPVYITDQKDTPLSKAEEAIAKLFTELEESGYRNPAKFIPSNFSEPSNIIRLPVKSHRQRLSKMRQISRRYRK